MSPIAAFPQAAIGDSAIYLQGVDVTADMSRRTVHTDSTGAILIGTEWLDRMPKVLGNADPMRLMQTLPGVHTNGEYDSGIHIDGCESSHCGLTLDGVPVYGASHLLGFFSVFNASHFNQLRLNHNTYSASSMARLGAEVDMMLPSSASQVSNSLEGAAGLMSSQGTWRIRASEKTAVLLSARRSYLNLLYGHFLKMDDMALKYGFGDYNATLLYSPTTKDCITLNFYGGNDNANMDEYRYQANVGLDWHNVLGAVGWKRHTEGFDADSKVYITQYGSNLAVREETLNASLESSIQELGAKVSLRKGSLHTGLHFSNYAVMPQSPIISGLEQQKACRSHSSALYASVGYDLSLGSNVRCQLGTKLHQVLAKSANHTSIDPYVNVSVQASSLGKLDISLGTQSQHLWQTGVSSMGLPTEFWMSVEECGIKPQKAIGVDVAYSRHFADDALKMEVRGYVKRMTNQVEYEGDLLQMLSTYDLKNHLLYGRGYNVGMNVRLQKERGRLRGWLSYSWQRVRRTFTNEGYSDSYPSSHERPHELNAVATYRLTPRLDFGSCLAFASGTPFTAPTEMYLVNGNFVAQYAAHNSNRLPAYFRWDLSANYDFKSRKSLQHGLNFSIYNVTARGNALYYRIKYSKNEERIGYRPTIFALRIMPSISYYFKL